MTRRAPNADLTAFLNRIESTEAVVGVVGLGYVGLPVALSFAEAGFRVRGVDVDESRIESLEVGKAYLGDVQSDQIVDLMKAGRFSVGSDTVRVTQPGDKPYQGRHDSPFKPVAVVLFHL